MLLPFDSEIDYVQNKCYGGEVHFYMKEMESSSKRESWANIFRPKPVTQF